MASYVFSEGLARRASGALLALAAVLPALCGGCASRFTTETQYLAPGFTRGSLRGQTVAVLPLAALPTQAPPPASAPAPVDPARAAASTARYDEGSELEGAAEVAGVARGLREAGARVRVLSSADSAAVAARPATVGTSYLLVVRLTGADVYREFVPRRGGRMGEIVSRTTRRRVGLRLTLLRLPDARPVWLAGGTGEAWQTRAGPADPDPSAAPGAGPRADDMPSYPPPPDPAVVSRRLTRRLIAHLPFATELEPN